MHGRADTSAVVGQVAEASAGKAEVLAQFGAACNSCSAKCARRVPSELLIQARTPATLSAGQRVILDPDAGALAQISLSLYLFPVIGFLCGAFLSYSSQLGDAMQALSGLAGLFFGLATARFFLRRRYASGTPVCAVQTNDY